MRWLGNLWFRIRALLGRGRFEEELGEEFQFHLEMEARKLMAQGRTPDQARREARIRFGGEERFREQVRLSWGVSALTDLGADIRFARRQLMKNPAFSALAVLTLALGIGGTVALFSVSNGLMLRPLPFPDEDRVVSFWSDYNWRGEEFDVVKDLPRFFESVAAYSNDALTLQTEDETTMVLATIASAELFDVLQVAPLLGRTLQEGDDRAGAEPVVVLGHGLWQTAFGGDREIVGKRINLSGEQTTVVGVMPERFYFPSPEMKAFVPLDLDPADPVYANNGWLVLTGRLRDGTTEAQVTNDLAAITSVLGERYDYPERWDKTRNPYVIPVREYVLGDVRPALLLLLAAAGVLLLMACVNVAALILTKTVDRTREMSVRAALGASRSRLARQVLTESVILGLVAGVAGVGLAGALFDVFVASLPIDAAFRETLSLDWAALLAAVALSLLSGGLISLAPMRNLLRGELADGVFSERSQGSGTAHAGHVQNLLVVAEVLLAVVLVAGASLLVRTVGELRSLDPGFDPEGVLSVGLIVSAAETTSDERALFFTELVEQVRALPGVTHAGFMNRLPLRDGGYQGPVAIEGRPDLEGVNRPNAMYRPVGPDVFAALDVEVIRGRGIEPGDIAGGPPVAVINETFARTIWGDGDPVGRSYYTGFVGQVEVVGVVRDIAVTDLVGDQPMTGFYAWDQAERGEPYGILVVRSGGDPAALAGPIRALIREEPRVALARVQTMTEVLDAEMVEPLQLRFFLGLFGLLGLVLGTVGVYGVVSYSVQRRQAEFGIRLALGAKPNLLVRDVIRRAVAPVVLGIVGGTVMSLLVSRTIAGFLFGVSPTDPASLLFAGAVLLVAGATAALFPALRARATEPAVALRTD